MIEFALVAFLAQDESAEEIFKRIEKNILEADTLRIRFDYGTENRRLPDPECGAKRGGSWGTLVLKVGDMLIFEERACSGRLGEFQRRLVSDGSKLSQAYTFYKPDGTKSESSRPVEVPERDKPRNLSENVRVAFARAGSIGVKNIVWKVMESPKNHTPDARDLYRVSNFSKGREEGDKKSLSYKLTISRPALTPIGRMESSEIVTLWYEAKSFRLLKRSDYLEDQKEGATIVMLFDEYEEFVVNEPIPDNKFSVQPLSK